MNNIAYAMATIESEIPEIPEYSTNVTVRNPSTPNNPSNDRHHRRALTLPLHKAST